MSEKFNSKNTNITKSVKVIIIGAGICGLAIGWDLIRNGAEVHIYDKGEVADGSTNKSGGMLAGGIENEPSEANLWNLTRYSQSLWKQYRLDLESASGKNIRYQNHGTMMLGTTKDDLAQIEFIYNYQKGLGVNVEWLSGRDVKKMEPHLKTVGGMWCEDDHQVNSGLLAKALAIAIENDGGKIYTNTHIKSISHSNGKASGIVLDDNSIISAEKIIVSAGVNCPDLLNGIADIPIRPLKGQMLSLKMHTRLIDRVIWSPKTYLIPKSNDTLMIGATVEEQGFNNDNTAGGILALLESAWRILPAIEDLPIKYMWVGHRPTARDDRPILGELPITNIYIAGGHHRNGILLAPATGKIMADMILEKEVNKIVKDFSINRFL